MRDDGYALSVGDGPRIACSAIGVAAGLPATYFLGFMVVWAPIFSVFRNFLRQKNGAKVLKNRRNLEWCEGKHVELDKR